MIIYPSDNQMQWDRPWVAMKAYLRLEACTTSHFKASPEHERTLSLVFAVGEIYISGAIASTLLIAACLYSFLVATTSW
jgi:hypothetical protein